MKVERERNEASSLVFYQRRKRGMFGRVGRSFEKRFLKLVRRLVPPWLRFLERAFGPSVIPWILWPSVVLDALFRFPDYAYFKKLRSVFPREFWKGLAPWKHYLLMIRDWQRGIVIALLSDRLRQPGWTNRFIVENLPSLGLSHWKDRPIVLTYLHTGGFNILRYWARAQGFKCASYVGEVPEILRHESAQKIFLQADAVNDLDGFTHFIGGKNSLRAALKFLAPGRILLMALDAGRLPENSLSYSVGAGSIQLREGPARIAAAVNALLVPVIIRPERGGRYIIHFGAPVPDNLLKSRNPRLATEFLLKQIWKSIEEEPSLLGWTTLEAIAPQWIQGRTPWP